MDAFRILLTLALRNLRSNPWKTVIVGVIMFAGTFVVVLGTALLDSVEASMARSVTSSIAGHLQVYDANAKDRLALFGDGVMAPEDVGRMPDFRKVKDSLLELDNVKAVVPMGMSFGIATQGNELDQILEALRKAVGARDAEGITRGRARIEQAAALMHQDFELRKPIAANPTEIDDAMAVLDRIGTEDFWTWVAAEPDAALQWLDIQVAPLGEDTEVVWVRYVGTDLDTFSKNFDTFEVVDGDMVPPGRRGFLFNKKYYEEGVKNKVARDLDAIHKAIHVKGKTIETDATLRAKIKQMAREYPRVTLQLEPADAAAVEAGLRATLPSAEDAATLNDLVQRFLEVDDSNFDERYAQFYELIAPKIRLYAYDIGDTLTLQSMSESGYFKSANVKIYGTFRFKGLEGSDLAGSHNLLDIMTFRDLYGLLTEERRREIDAIRENVGIEDVNRNDAEDALFGGDTDIVSEDTTTGGFDEFADADLSDRKNFASELERVTYTQDEIDSGVALNAAVVLKDATLLRRTMVEIQALSKEKELGLQVVDWQTAAGIVGQFIVVVRLVLFISVFIIFGVALVIINNSMVMSTMERVQEIGTMRAIGAPRKFIMRMLMIETLMLGFIAGGLGAAGALGVITIAGFVGVPATEDFLIFLFSGPRLYPSAGPGNLVTGVFVIIIVSVFATLYPARIATRIQPVVAMEAAE